MQEFNSGPAQESHNWGDKNGTGQEKEQTGKIMRRRRPPPRSRSRWGGNALPLGSWDHGRLEVRWGGEEVKKCSGAARRVLPKRPNNPIGTYPDEKDLRPPSPRRKKGTWKKEWERNDDLTRRSNVVSLHGYP